MHTKNTRSHCTIWLSETSIRICVATRPLVFVVRTPYIFCCRGWFLFFDAVPGAMCITLLLCVFFFHFAFPWWFWIFYERNGNESHASRITVQTKCFNIPQLKICNSTTIRSYIPNGHLVYSHFVAFFMVCVRVCCHWIVEYFSKYIWKRWMV